MSVARRLLLLVALATLLPGLAAAGKTLDGGKLESDWFSSDAVFREDDEIDYLWVSPGFSLAGKSLHFVPWPEPEFLGPKAGERDEKDRRLAKMMNGEMHELFRGRSPTPSAASSRPRSRRGRSGSRGGSSTARPAPRRPRSSSASAPARGTPRSTCASSTPRAARSWPACITGW
ncbi:MAG: hypothetical protein M5U13_00770 [Thermoanaerobaculia bacterium]|nr:hypothetical protein [Thermoanaerobaculia bacterium]